MSTYVISSKSPTVSVSSSQTSAYKIQTFTLRNDNGGIPAGARIISVSLNNTNITWTGSSGTNKFAIWEKNSWNTTSGAASAIEGIIFGYLSSLSSVPSTFNIMFTFTKSGTGTASRTYTVPSITITYVYSSMGTLDKSNVNAGDTITLTIEPADPSYYHTVKWYLVNSTGVMQSDYLVTSTIDHDVTTCSFVIPNGITPAGSVSWLNCANVFATSTVGSVRCELITYTDESRTTQQGESFLIPFTLSMKEVEYLPTVTINNILPYNFLSTARENLLSNFYTYYSYPRITFSTNLKYNTGGFYTITENDVALTDEPITLSSGEQTIIGNTNPSAPITSGKKVYVITVTDNRGQTVTASQTIAENAILTLNKPTISLETLRCDEDGTENVVGAYLKVKYTGVIEGQTEIGNNMKTITLYNGPTAYSNSNITQPSEPSGIALRTGGELVPFNTNESYDFKIKIVDSYDYSAEATSRLSKAVCALHVHGSGKGFAIGMFSNADAEHPKFEVAYPSYFSGDIYDKNNKIITGQSAWEEITINDTNFTMHTTCKKKLINGVVYLNGAVRHKQGTSGSYDDGAVQTIIDDIGDNYTPENDTILPLGGDARGYLLYVYADSGKVDIRNKTGSDKGTSTNWIRIDCSYAL